MGMDSETRELPRLWRWLSAKGMPACSKKARYLAVAAGLEKTPEFAVLFDLSAADLYAHK
jgi:hypothetical protein